MATLREEITEYMSQEGKHVWPVWYCTWWFKFHISEHRAPVIRKELERMEREGLVESDRRQTNNTKWRLIKRDAMQAEGE